MGKRTRRLGTALALVTAMAAVGLVSVAASSAPTTGFTVVDLTVVEGNTPWQDVKVRVTRNGTITGAASVKVSTVNGSARAGTETDGGDYRTVSAVTVNFAANIASATATIRIWGSTVPEANEVFFTTLSAPTGAAIFDGLGAVTITNDDDAVPQGFLVGDAVGVENGTATVPVFRSGPATAFASVTVTSAALSPAVALGCPALANGCDFQQTQTTLSFAAGEIMKTFSVGLFKDTHIEGNETFAVRLSAASGAPIADDEGEVTILSQQPMAVGFELGDAMVAEGASGTKLLAFTVTRHGSTVGPASVRWTAIAGTATSTDFTPVTTPVQLNFADGESVKTLSVTIKGDLTIEPNETFTVKISSPVGATILDGTAIGTIFNDD